MNSTTPHPDPALQNIIQRITENLLIDQIYLHPYTIHGKRVNQLYILLRNSAGQGIVSARALCNLAVAERPSYRCHVALPADINRKINQGNMRATLICQPDKLVFEHPEVDTLIQLPKIDYRAWYAQAESYFEKELSRIQAFEEGYAFYSRKANYGQAAFMLHQVIEQGYRAAENLVMGKEKISHSLRNHQEYIAPFCPELGMLFAKQHEISILAKLDESYSSARYDHDFSMSKEDLAVAADRAKELLAYLAAFNRDLLDEIQWRQQEEEMVMEVSQASVDEAAEEIIKVDGDITNKEIVATTTESDSKTTVGKGTTSSKLPYANDHQERILSAIGQYFTPTHVFCFAYQSTEERSVSLVTLDSKQIWKHRYYLAILTEEQPEHALHKQHQINEVLGEEMEIVALYFKLSTFNRKLEEGHEFFHFMANSAERWFGDEGQQTTEGAATPVDFERRERVWKNHLWNAEGLLEMAEDHIGTRHDESTAVVIAQAMEQLCLGLLYAFWGYRPDNILNLMYLIKLTESITPFARTSFCLDIPEERKMVERLSNALNEFRYNSSYDVDDYALYIVYDRLKVFIENMEELVNQHLETLEMVEQ